jgi:outer membrane murein-binding lipoprotein Lpp
MEVAVLFFAFVGCMLSSVVFVLCLFNEDQHNEIKNKLEDLEHKLDKIENKMDYIREKVDKFEMFDIKSSPFVKGYDWK